jgi:AcrR family transcriptional regulator
MLTPVRILRALIDSKNGGPPALTPREREREERILAEGQFQMAKHGSHKITLTGLAKSVGITRDALQRHFCDIESLLAAILYRHLANIAAELAKIPSDAADLHQLRRAAYVAFTRTESNALTEPHLLLVRERHMLPDDLRPGVEAARRDLGSILTAGEPERTLSLLDSPNFSPEDIELALGISDPAAASPPQPRRVPASVPFLSPDGPTATTVLHIWVG